MAACSGSAGYGGRPARSASSRSNESALLVSVGFLLLLIGVLVDDRFTLI